MLQLMNLMMRFFLEDPVADEQRRQAETARTSLRFVPFTVAVSSAPVSRGLLRNNVQHSQGGRR